MYIVNFAILHWLVFFNFIDYFVDTILNYFVRYLIVKILTILMATVLYFFIEVPFQNLGKKIIFKMENKAKNITAV